MNDAMNTAPIAPGLAHDLSLAVGARVMARWTNCFRSYVAAATVTKANAKSVRVCLDAPVTRADGTVIYRAGHVLTLPRYVSDKFTYSNCVAPVAA